MHKPGLKYVDKPGFVNCKNQIINPESRELKKEAIIKNLHGYWKKAIAGIDSQIGLEISRVKKIEITNPAKAKRI